MAPHRRRSTECRHLPHRSTERLTSLRQRPTRAALCPGGKVSWCNLLFYRAGMKNFRFQPVLMFSVVVFLHLLHHHKYLTHFSPFLDISLYWEGAQDMLDGGSTSCVCVCVPLEYRWIWWWIFRVFLSLHVYIPVLDRGHQRSMMTSVLTSNDLQVDICVNLWWPNDLYVDL